MIVEVVRYLIKPLISDLFAKFTAIDKLSASSVDSSNKDISLSFY